MPISPLRLQRRHAELGRIRLGNKVATSKGGSRPNKLDRFRFTSTSERLIRDIASLYGGTAQPWDNSGKPEWEVFTDANDIPVTVIKGALTQWFEFWSGGGCIHRCDGSGAENVLTGQPCDLEEIVQVGRTRINPHTEAKPTTRLGLMLPELDTIGAWRMESKGFNAAVEIPAIAELAMYVGDMVPARLYLQERRSVKDGETNRFVVPVLDLQIGRDRLREIVAQKAGIAPLPSGSGVGELAAPERPALEAGGGAVADPLPGFDDITGASDVKAVYAIYRFLQERGALTAELEQACKDRAAMLEASAATAASGPDEDGAYDAVVVPEDTPAAPAAAPAASTSPISDDPDVVWQTVLRTAGQAGMSETDVKAMWTEHFPGDSLPTATAQQLGDLLALIENAAA